MTEFSVEIDTKELERALAAAPREFSRATRNALNDTARSAQRVQQRHIGVKFSFKRQGTKRFLQRTVYFPAPNRAKTSKLEAKLEINPARGTLAKFEEGGPKTPLRADLVFMPGREIRTVGGQVKRGMGLKSFQPFTVQGRTSRLRRRGGRIVKASTRKNRGARGGTRVQRVGRKGSFWIKTRSGHPALVRRVRKKLQLLYIGLPRVQLEPQLDFHENAVDAARRTWPLHMRRAIEPALRRAGLLR